MKMKSIIAGFAIETVLVIGTVLLHVVIPARKTTGYCCDHKMVPLSYKLNGFLMLLVTFTLFMVAPKGFQLILYENFSGCFLGANVIGLLFSIALLVRGGHEKYYRCFTVDQIGKDLSHIPLGENDIPLLQRFYLGCEWNPRFWNIDSKMILYAYGAIRLELNILSGCAHQFYETESISNALFVYAVMFSWFLHEYMFFENVHLYTYDLFAEKLGFKLTWGCLVFYPFFYCIGIFSILQARKGADLSVPVCLAILVVFLAGWICTRGANLQKYSFRVEPKLKRCLFGLIEQKTVPGTRILCSGFWGTARHFNYFGEIVQGIALAIPGVMLSSSNYFMILPMLYPLFYIGLFIPRQIDDDALCLKKYGDKWKEYCTLVPWKICPGVW